VYASDSQRDRAPWDKRALYGTAAVPRSTSSTSSLGRPVGWPDSAAPEQDSDTAPLLAWQHSGSVRRVGGARFRRVHRRADGHKLLPYRWIPTANRTRGQPTANAAYGRRARGRRLRGALWITTPTGTARQAGARDDRVCGSSRRAAPPTPRIALLRRDRSRFGAARLDRVVALVRPHVSLRPQSSAPRRPVERSMTPQAVGIVCDLVVLAAAVRSSNRYRLVIEPPYEWSISSPIPCSRHRRASFGSGMCPDRSAGRRGIRSWNR